MHVNVHVYAGLRKGACRHRMHASVDVFSSRVVQAAALPETYLNS